MCNLPLPSITCDQKIRCLFAQMQENICIIVLPVQVVILRCVSCTFAPQSLWYLESAEQRTARVRLSFSWPSVSSLVVYSYSGIAALSQDDSLQVKVPMTRLVRYQGCRSQFNIVVVSAINFMCRRLKNCMHWNFNRILWTGNQNMTRFHRL